jgi:hypothetical protein
VNEVGTAIGAAVVVKHKVVETDHTMIGDPLQQERRLILEHCADGNWFHVLADLVSGFMAQADQAIIALMIAKVRSGCLS